MLPHKWQYPNSSVGAKFGFELLKLIDQTCVIYENLWPKQSSQRFIIVIIIIYIYI